MSWNLSGFENKVALVSGAGRMRSIGRPIAVELARAGCKVVLVGTGREPSRYPDDEKAAGWRDIDSVADEIRALGGTAVPLVSDVSDAAAVRTLAEQIIQRFGRLDILINNAGASRGNDRVPVTELDPAAWRRIIDVNLTGSFLVSAEMGRHMIAAGNGGCIVNISSIAGKRFDPNNAAYAASKAGLQALTACMSQEMARHKIRVNAVCPGLIDTSRMDGIGRGQAWDQLVQRLVPLGRAGTGNDIAHAVMFLCSEQAGWVTGQAWNVDGGTVVQH
jgi:NAD(P)-dependent dehydrogenase (short-subunit alcohol dehydrogenase family)